MGEPSHPHFILSLRLEHVRTPRTCSAPDSPRKELVSLNPQPSSSLFFTRHCSQFCCSNLSLATQRGEQPAPQPAAAPSPAIV